MGIVLIIIGLIFWGMTRTNQRIVGTYEWATAEKFHVTEYYIIGAVLIVLGIILIIRKNNKTRLAQTSLINSVNWTEAQSRINSVKSAFEHLDVITLQSDGEITTAEIYGAPELKLKHDDYYWAMEAFLYPDNRFALRHVDDYVNIPYPYANKWEEMLDNHGGISIKFERVGDSIYCFSRCHLSIPRGITMDTIKRHLSI